MVLKYDVLFLIPILLCGTSRTIHSKASDLSPVSKGSIIIRSDAKQSVTERSQRKSCDDQAAGEKVKKNKVACGKVPSKVSRDLLSIYNKYQAMAEEIGNTEARKQFRPSNTLAQVGGGYVVIDAVAKNDPKKLRADLEALGLIDVAVYGRIVSGRLPITAVPKLKKLSSLHFSRPSYAKTHTGSVKSQGDAAVRADLARNSFGLSGKGVTVGVLSDSYDCLGGAASGIASRDLPADVNVLAEEIDCVNGIDEGRAMAELVYDVAPEANIAFHSVLGGVARFAAGLIALAKAGARVIVDDVSYFAEPFFQPGILAQVAKRVTDEGVVHFTAIGNQNAQSYEAPFRPSGIILSNGAEFHDFDPGPGVDICQQVTAPGAMDTIISFQWDEPFFSVSGPPGSASDMDIYIFDSSCSSILAGGEEGNIGQDPLELTFISETRTFNIAIINYKGPHPGLMKAIFFGPGVTVDEYATLSSTAFSQGNIAGSASVGATFYQNAFNLDSEPPTLEPYSAIGGTPVLFDEDGNRLDQPIVPRKPDFVAPDGTNTTFFGKDLDGDGFPNFPGTSAAAPHAAAVAALMIQARSDLTPEEVLTALRATAIDMDDPLTDGFDVGFDFGSGYGFIQADAALEFISADVPVGGPAGINRKSLSKGYRRSPRQEPGGVNK